jgi:glycosyltransferase involved in cell wall biosynthesis
MAERSPGAAGAALRPREIAHVIAREQAVYDGASAIFTLSDWVRRSFIEDFRIHPGRVVTVHAGPNLDTSRIPRRRPTSHAGGPPTILFVGGEYVPKGGDLLVRAFVNVRRRFPDARLVLIGPREFHSTEPGVEWLGFLRKDNPEHWRTLVECYATADVFCLPTRFDAFGIVLVEAMLFGLPCVATGSWAIPEIVVDGETGFTFPAEDVDALTDRLLRLLENPDLVRRMGEAGRARAERLFTWSVVVRKMTEVMEATLEERRSGARPTGEARTHVVR